MDTLPNPSGSLEAHMPESSAAKPRSATLSKKSSTKNISKTMITIDTEKDETKAIHRNVQGKLVLLNIVTFLP